MRLNTWGGERECNGDYQVAYGLDAGRVRPDLTLQLGLRWDRATYDNNTGRVTDVSKLQPRLGAAWDVAGNGRNLVRASWGRFMSPATMTMSFFARASEAPTEFWYSCSDFGFSDPAACMEIADAWDLGYRTDQEAWDPVGWVLFPEDVIGTEPNQIASDLRPMYVDQWMVGFERELFPAHVLLESYEHRFSSARFSASIADAAFHQDPTDPGEKLVVATVRFTPPVDPKSLESRVEMRLTGDPALLMLPPDAGADALEDIRHSMGLDKPLVAQYGLFNLPLPLIPMRWPPRPRRPIAPIRPHPGRAVPRGSAAGGAVGDVPAEPRGPHESRRDAPAPSGAL